MSRMDIDPRDRLTDINAVAAFIDAHPEYFPEPRQLPCVGGCGRSVPSGSFICGQCGTEDLVLARLNAQREVAPECATDRLPPVPCYECGRPTSSHPRLCNRCFVLVKC